MQITIFVQQSDFSLKITLPRKIKSSVDIYNKAHTIKKRQLMRTTNISEQSAHQTKS